VKTLYESWRRSFFMSQMYAAGTRYAFELLGLGFIAAFLAFFLQGQAAGMPAALVFLAVFYRLAPRLLAVQDGLFQARTYHSWVLTWEQRRRLAESAAEPPGGEKAPALRATLELCDVSYRYPGGERDALSDVTMVIPVGRAVGIIGASGSGKSTLLDLLTGLLVPSKGSVLLDGAALYEFDLHQWRRRIGLVQQETPIVHGTVTQNIAWGEGEPDAERVRSAAAMAGALEFIEALPHRFETLVGERGGRLSGGQRQRLALARALFRQPDLLILDEPTSALDGESELVVRAALERIKGRCTMLIVAHRIETLSFCDHIVALDAGRIVEQGDWTVLASRPGSLVSRMLKVQQRV
jgi:ABC-type multidrug transport system fused ATPase/permease subunit